MFRKNHAVLIASLGIAILLLASTAGLAFADTLTETSLDLNGQGVLVPGGYNAEALSVTKLDPYAYSDSQVRFMGQLLDVQFLADGARLAFPTALTYVYFNMNQTERVAWDAGQAGIYFQDPAGGSWLACSSTFLVAGANPPEGRLACIATQSGVYGLGIRETPADLQPGAAVGPGVANASFFTETSAQTGNQGIYITTGLNLDQIAMRLVEPGTEAVPDTPFGVRRSIILVDWIGDELLQIPLQGLDPEAATASTAEPASIPGLAYVFYVLDRTGRTMWDNGSLSIYAYDQAGNTWVACPTVLTASGEHGTVSCIASQFTYYALGETE